MQAGAYDTVLILFCFSFFPLPLRSISMLQPLFFSFLLPVSLSLSVSPSPSLSLSPSIPPFLSLCLVGSRYNVWATGCELFPVFRKNRSANNL